MVPCMTELLAVKYCICRTYTFKPPSIRKEAVVVFWCPAQLTPVWLALSFVTLKTGVTISHFLSDLLQTQLRCMTSKRFWLCKCAAAFPAVKCQSSIRYSTTMFANVPDEQPALFYHQLGGCVSVLLSPAGRKLTHVCVCVCVCERERKCRLFSTIINCKYLFLKKNCQRLYLTVWSICYFVFNKLSFCFQINLRLILVSGKTHEFLFSPSDSAAEITDHVYSHWPEGTGHNSWVALSKRT